MSRHHEDHTDEPRDDRAEVDGHRYHGIAPTQEPADVEAHTLKAHEPAESASVKAHSIKSHKPTDEPADVEAHKYSRI